MIVFNLFNQRTLLHFNMSYPGYSSIFTNIFLVLVEIETNFPEILENAVLFITRNVPKFKPEFFI